MKVLLVNKSDSVGGAAIACIRLLHALVKNDVEAKALVQEKRGDDPNISCTTRSAWKRLLNFWRFVRERLLFLPYEKSKEIRFLFSPANTGENIKNHALAREADIIHFHWINQGYLSLKSISRILSLKKPVVWTMHDMWTFTGGCHHSGSCKAYKTRCSNCPFLKHPRKYDLSTKLWWKKYNIWGKGNITFVACSQWLAGCAKSSGLLGNCRVEAIPNPIETGIFKPLDKSELKLNVQLKEGEFIILFGAVKVSSYFKGFSFFRDALNLLKQNHPEISEKIVIGVFGMVSEELLDSLPFKNINFSVVSDKKQMAEIYSLSDVYVTSSLQENLPNTIMESFSCGTPAVAFNVGGIPEMIDHMENGYLAEYMSADDLAHGIYWTLFEADRVKLSENARKKAVDNYSEAVVAKRYTALYEDILKNTKISNV